MSQRLGFPVAFFAGDDLEEPPVDGSSFRSMTRLTSQRRERALAAGTLAMELSNWIETKFKLPTPSVPTYATLDPETAAAAVRSEWELGELPIKNMIHVAESRGVRVFSLTEDCREMDAFSFWREDRPYIFLNTMKSAEHSRFDCAHEIGHLVLHPRGSKTRMAEFEADQFASAFLMPEGDVLANAPKSPSVGSLIQAKRRWNVSLAALVYRLHKVGVVTEWQYRALFVELSKHGYRTREPNPAQAERSQALAKVLGMLKDEGISRAEIAAALNFPADEIGKLLFGLVPLSPLPGGAVKTERSASREHLRVV